MDSPELWRWLWLVATGVLVVGEVATIGFFLAPFAIGAALAAVLAFAGVDLAWQWLGFVIASGVAYASFYPLRRRLDRDVPADGIGARRLIGQAATVLRAIPAGATETGLVRVGREEWRAESLEGTAIEEGTTVRVVEVTGTRLRVWPTAPAPSAAAIEARSDADIAVTALEADLLETPELDEALRLIDDLPPPDDRPDA